MAVACDQEFLIAGVPELRELAVLHDSGKLSHLIIAVGSFAKFRAATVFFDASNAAGAAYGEAELRQSRFNFLGSEFRVDVPHAETE